jgi:hypothetical protein
MENFINIDNQVFIGAACLFIFAFMLGRLTKRSKASKNYNRTLASLNSKIQTAGLRKSEYYLYYTQLKHLSIALVLAYVIGIYLIYTYDINIPQEFYIASVLFCALVYAVGCGCYWVSQNNSRKQKMYETQIKSSKSEIIKELGPEVIEMFQSTECDKKCKENVENLQRNLRKHQRLIQKISAFQWCDACPQSKQCTGKCGARFWNYIKDVLNELRGS